MNKRRANGGARNQRLSLAASACVAVAVVAFVLSRHGGGSRMPRPPHAAGEPAQTTVPPNDTGGSGAEQSPPDERLPDAPDEARFDYNIDEFAQVPAWVPRPKQGCPCPTCIGIESP